MNTTKSVMPLLVISLSQRLLACLWKRSGSTSSTSQSPWETMGTKPTFALTMLVAHSSPMSPYGIARTRSMADHWPPASRQHSLSGSGHLEITPVTLSPCAALRGNSAKGLARRTQRSFAALRMTARTALKSAHGKPYLQMSDDSGRPIGTPEDVAGHAGTHSPDREADLRPGVVPGGDEPVRAARPAFRAGPEALPHSNEYPARSQDAQYRYLQYQNDQNRQSARDRGSPTPA